MEKFLKDLEVQLDVLEEADRKKVIKAYKAKIKSYIKEGLTEEEALNKIGSVSDNAQKIYEEYKININQKKTFGGKIQSSINYCAKVLTDITNDVIARIKNSSTSFSLETFFEIIIKVLVLVLIFLLLKFPFIFVIDVCKSLFGLIFYPFDVSLSYLVEFLLETIYIIICVFVSVLMFKNYFVSSTKDEKIVEPLENDSKDSKTVSQKNNNGAVTIIKIILYVVIIAPLIIANIGLYGLTSLAIFLYYKEVEILGLAILLGGASVLFSSLISIMTDGMNGKARIPLFTIILSTVVIVAGSLMTIDDLSKFDYNETLENSYLEPNTTTYVETIDSEYNLLVSDGVYAIASDNSLAYGEIKIVVNYYDAFIDVNKIVYNANDINYISIYTETDKINHNMIKTLYGTALHDLRDYKIYNYGLLDEINVIVYVNDATKDLIK